MDAPSTMLDPPLRSESSGDFIDKRQSLGHLPALDGVRGMAALMVMFYHAAGFGFALQWQLLNAGVDLFFVLSGFLITRILLSAKGQKRYFINFYGRRTLRVFPLYYGFLVVFFLVRPWVVGNPIPSVDVQGWFWVYLQNIPFTFTSFRSEPGHFWSLAVEEHFYLFWPFLVSWLSPRRMLHALLIMVVGAALLRVPMKLQGWEPYYFTLTRVDALSMGAVLAWLERYRPRGIAGDCELYRYGFAITGFAVGVYLLFDARIPTLLSSVIWPSLVGCFFLFFMGWTVAEGRHGILGRVLGHGMLAYSGKVSYGLYVFHPLCFLVARRSGLPPIAQLGVGMALSFLVAALSFRLFESPFLKLKRHFA